MFQGKKIAVVMPAYKAARTIEKTYRETVEQGIVDIIIIVDDSSPDDTVAVARTLKAPGIKTIVQVHQKNLGYGGNQKTCYHLALREGADVVIMVHPDYQYTPKLIPAMAGMIISGLYDCVLGSRIIGGGALKGGMPGWKYIANRLLTLAENMIMGSKFSELHTGYRAFSRGLLERIPLKQNADGFVFDNEILAQTLWCGCLIGEVSTPTRYFPEASSINFWNSVRYGFGCLRVAFLYRLCVLGLMRSKLFPRVLHTTSHTTNHTR